MKKIGIISDTHGLFDAPLRDFLADVDEIWHAGDFGTIETADAIAAFKPLRGVYGNIDGGATRLQFRDHEQWLCENTRVLMTHIGGYPGRYDRKAYELIRSLKPNIFIAGHSHILRVRFDNDNNLLYINPGAAGIYGFHTVRTAVRLTITSDHITDLEIGEWQKKRPNKI